MLSFSGDIHMRNKMNIHKTIINKITKSLQVPCSPLFNTSKSYLPGKRVLPFISHKREERRFDGSITVEAAVVLPLFLFFGVAVLAPVRWLDTQRQIQMIVERLGEDLSQYAYVMETGKTEAEAQSEQQSELFSDVAAGLWVHGQTKSYADTIRVIKSEVPDEQGNIHLELMYQERIPFFFESISGVTMRVAAKRRAWVGLDGKLTGKSMTDDSEQKMVYVTPDGERYHRYRDCQYLANICKAISTKELQHLRNPDGKIYHICTRCTSGQTIQDTVYITTWGTRYHNDRACAAMSTYFRKVPLSEVIHYGECSVCARRNN